MIEQPCPRVGPAEPVLKNGFGNICNGYHRATYLQEVRLTIVNATAYQQEITRPAQDRNDYDQMQQQIRYVRGSLHQAIIGADQAIRVPGYNGVEKHVAPGRQQYCQQQNDYPVFYRGRVSHKFLSGAACRDATLVTDRGAGGNPKSYRRQYSPV